VALLWTHFQFLELKAPGSDKESYIKAGYSELSRGSNPQYLRASIRLAGSPGCEVYEETMKRQGHGTLNFLEETQCVALEPEDVAVSRYAFTSGKPTDLSKGIQMRELVDLSTGKVHAEYFRDYSYGSNCPRGGCPATVHAPRTAD
jgi:hypothetical protein